MANDKLANLIEAVRHLQYALRDIGPDVDLAEIALTATDELDQRHAAREFRSALLGSSLYTNMARFEDKGAPLRLGEVIEISGVRIVMRAPVR